MIYELFEKLDSRVHFEKASAHCDIPCGIYDPSGAQIAALTVVRMIDLMNELDKTHSERDIAYQNSMARYVAVKEEHAEKVKHEVRIIWGDYIKPQHIEKHADFHEVVHTIMQLGSKSRQTADRETAVQLVEAVNKFAEMFWDTKGIMVKRTKAPYAPALEMVYPNL